MSSPTTELVAAPSRLFPQSVNVPRAVAWPIWMGVCLLLAAAQMQFAGYEFGVGNQTIQIPFLKYFMNPALYPHDAMLQQTIRDYPTFFFRGLAALCPLLGGVASCFFILHLITTAAVFLAVFALCRAMFRDSWAGLAALLLLLAGQHRALAGDEMYSLGFTHTWAVFPLAIFSLVLLYRERRVTAFLLAGALFNWHALTAAYLVFALLVAALIETIDAPAADSSPNQPFFHRWMMLPLRRVGLPLLAFLLAAAPTLFVIASHRQTYTADWFGLTYWRSADHSFPSSWWQEGNPDVPRFALLLGLAAASFGWITPSTARRKTVSLAAAFLLLFAAGYVFAEIWPLGIVVRAQLFRCSRLLLILAICQIGFGVAAALRRSLGSEKIPAWQRGLDLVAALAVFITVAIPIALPWLPYAFLLAIIAALANGRLSALASLPCAAVLLLVIVATQSIHFPVPGLNAPWWVDSALSATPVGFWLALGIALILAGITKLRPPAWLSAIAMLTALTVTLALSTQLYKHSASDQSLAAASDADAFRDAQNWARLHTPVDALFLTPARPGGFRIGAERAVVAEWRDGTQLYFNADFAPTWLDRITALQPGLTLSADSRRLLLRGQPLESLDDPRLIALAQRYNATHILLPATRKTSLQQLYRNAQWAIYLPLLPPAPPAPPTPATAPKSQIAVPKEALDKDRWLAQEKFMAEVVAPNIDKYRKRNLAIRIVDALGQPLANARYDLNETRQAFSFAASMPFFKEPVTPSYFDYKPPAPTDPREKDRVLEVFNASLIPFSAKWMYIEPDQGRYDYADLDLYLAWCKEHNFTTEWHFITGYPPPWVYALPEPQQKEAILAHAREVMKRYGDQITYWQVTNELIFEEHVPDMIRAIRAIKPDAKLGLAYCEKYWVPGSDASRRNELLLGLSDLQNFKRQGIKLDFYATHGHRPFGLWADPKDMYAAYDAFAKEGIKIHISEFFEPAPAAIIGPMRNGVWTPELQADYYVRMFKVAFSHPAVELLNIWGIGPRTWQNGSGLLDNQYNPKPAFSALKNLIQNDFRTHAVGTLSDDGAAALRVFHGDYDLTITLPTGNPVHAHFTVAPNTTNLPTATMPADDTTQTITLHLDQANTTLQSPATP